MIGLIKRGAIALILSKVSNRKVSTQCLLFKNLPLIGIYKPFMSLFITVLRVCWVVAKRICSGSVLLVVVPSNNC